MAANYIHTNGIRLNVVQEGPEDGPLVILLHGFPEFSYGWRKQIPALADAGYRVWAPDQRGYNLSDKPEGISAYTLDELSRDVTGLIDAAGEERAYLVGHDWGAAVAWWVAANYPDRLVKLVNMNVPHPAVMNKNLRGNFSQLLKSWYMFFFQIPWLPETLIKINNWQAAAMSLTDSSRPGTFSEADLEKYREAWSQPGAFRSMINWYRAFVQKRPKEAGSLRIRMPTLLIWGAQDRFLGREMAEQSMKFCREERLEILEDATHWVQHEEPERVNQLLLDFLNSE